MLANKSAFSDADDEIIELTDIIEQGTPPSAGEDSVSDVQLDDLSDTGAHLDVTPEFEGEDDLDALLAELGAMTDSSGEAGGAKESAGSSAVVNPNETLDMPDMSEIENFLDDLNIPDQSSAGLPEQSSPGASAAAKKASAASIAAELDALLGIAEPAAPASSPAAAAPASFSASAAAAADELDALIEMAKPAASPVASSVASPAASVEDEFDAMIEMADSASSPIAPVAPASPSVSAAAAADELDALIEMPGAASSSAASASSAMDEFDALLATAGSASAPASSVSSSVSATDDLDVLIEMPGAVRSPAASASSAVDDLDALLETAGPAAASAAPAVPSASTALPPPLPQEWENLLGTTDTVALPAPALLSAVDDSTAIKDLGERLALFEQQAEERFARLENALLAAGGTVLPATGPEEVTALDSENIFTDGLQERLDAAGALLEQRLNERLGELEARLQGTAETTEAAAPMQEGLDAVAASLEQGLNERLEQRLNERLDERLGELEARLQGTAETTEAAPVQEGLDAVAASLEQRLEQRLEQLLGERLDERLGELEARLAEQQAQGQSLLTEAGAEQAQYMPDSQELEHVLRSMEEALRGLEARLDASAQQSAVDLERVAAAAAARIIREELLALFEEF